MVHLFKKKEKMLKELDRIAQNEEWNIHGYKENRIYAKDDMQIRLLKLKNGYKTIVSKEGKVILMDINKDKDLSMITAREAMILPF